MRAALLAVAILLSTVADARQAAQSYEVTTCPATAGDFDLLLARFANEAHLVRVAYDVYARDYSDASERDLGRLFDQPVVVFTIERVRHGRVLSAFLQFYRAANVAVSMHEETRTPMPSQQADEFAARMKAMFESAMPCQ